MRCVSCMYSRRCTKQRAGDKMMAKNPEIKQTWVVDMVAPFLLFVIYPCHWLILFFLSALLRPHPYMLCLSICYSDCKFPACKVLQYSVFAQLSWVPEPYFLRCGQLLSIQLYPTQRHSFIVPSLENSPYQTVWVQP